ncbi:MAG: hypothetical protein M2R45_03395 [Verrucomicrobia subdivision 3 bacterium]|nr:hypothetical protein [Limisphaerales bacterium]MCS1416693.1 hypothetical protein [Limisphaerales bacterium]
MTMTDFGMPPQQAGGQPRVSHSESSIPTGSRSTGRALVQLKAGISGEVREPLVAMGHQVKSGVSAFGGYQSIWRMEELLRYSWGAGPRKVGCAIGC